MNERPEEQHEQTESGSDQPVGDAPAPHDEAAPVPHDNAGGSNGSAPRDDAAESPADEQQVSAADAPETDAAPEMPEAEATSTVADATEQSSTEEMAPAEGQSPTEGVSPTEEESPAKPAKKKAKKSSGVVQPLEELSPEEAEEEESLDRDWYILKVQSNREKSIRDALERRVKVAGLERFFGEIIVPTEDVAEYKGGKRKVTKRKLWPGYIVVDMAINDDTWFLVRETPGIGDFTGSIGKPSPMQPHEVERILPKKSVETDEPQPIKIGIRFKPGDRVRVKDGYFQNFEGDVESIDEANGRVTVICSIFGRSTPVELEHWQIEEL